MIHESLLLLWHAFQITIKIVENSSMDENEDNENKFSEVTNAVHKQALVVKDAVYKKLNDQNFMQSYYTIFAVGFELYKAVTSSLLIVFVTQKCNGKECSTGDNMKVDDDEQVQSTMYESGLILNFITLFVFLILYVFEITREFYLIQYLEENKDAKKDSKAVAVAFKNIEASKLETICYIELWYKRIGAASIFMYILNIVVSAYVISYHSVGFFTAVSFITLVLFIVKKFINIFCLINADENIYLSAYSTNTVQYNDVDPDHKISDSDSVH